MSTRFSEKEIIELTNLLNEMAKQIRDLKKRNEYLLDENKRLENRLLDLEDKVFDPKNIKIKVDLNSEKEWSKQEFNTVILALHSDRNPSVKEKEDATKIFLSKIKRKK